MLYDCCAELPGNPGCSGENTPIVWAVAPVCRWIHALSVVISVISAARQSSGVVPNVIALAYVRAPSAWPDLGVHHIWPDTLLLPPSSSSGAFSMMTTSAPASANVIAAASPANPVPATTTSASLSHWDGTAAANAGAAVV